MKETVRLRRTTPGDLDFVLQTERDPDNAPYIVPWDRDAHWRALANPNIAHWFVETEADRQPVGYAILVGLADIHESIELTRTAMSVKGRGYGRSMLQWIKTWAFEEQRVNRLWLEVIDHNERARRLYASEGFQDEGLKREAVKFQGKLESICIMSMLRKEFEAADRSRTHDRTGQEFPV